MPSTALFVVDIQVDQAQDPKTEIPHAGRIRKSGETILAKARAAIDTARDAGRQPDLGIVFVQHEEKPEDGSLVNGSAPWKLVLSLRDTDSTEMLVSKNTCDTFESNPQLASQLKKEGIESIVVFGIQSEFCVQATSKGALAAGFKVTLLQGAHSTYDTAGKTAKEIEAEVENDLRERGARVVSWEEWQPEE